MTHATARLFEPLLRLLLPATGRRRAGIRPQQALTPATAHLCNALPSPGAVIDAFLLRPYVLTEAEREERRRQRVRRRELWFATQGVDIGPRHLHGMEVAAR